MIGKCQVETFVAGPIGQLILSQRIGKTLYIYLMFAQTPKTIIPTKTSLVRFFHKSALGLSISAKRDGPIKLEKATRKFVGKISALKAFER